MVVYFDAVNTITPFYSEFNQLVSNTIHVFMYMFFKVGTVTYCLSDLFMISLKFVY